MNRKVLSIVFATLMSTSAAAKRKAEPGRIPDSQVPAVAESSPADLSWQSPARLHRLLRSVRGSLQIGATGIEFRSQNKEHSYRWSYEEIETLGLWPRRIDVRTYEKRGRSRPGLQRFRFDLESELPPQVAARVAQRIGKPVRNGLPEPKARVFATLPALHLTAFGGSKSNGFLRFRAEGIDYVSPAPGESRSWRWSDLRTLSNLSPYHFVVFAHRETYSFDLKQPMSRALFDRLTDEVYAHNLDFKSSPGRAKSPDDL